jgi:serine protease Do
MMEKLNWNRKPVMAAAGLVLAGVLMGSLATAWANLHPFGLGKEPPVTAGLAAPAAAAERAVAAEPELRQGFRPVVKKALPAVVSISSSKVVRDRRMMPDPFWDFFGFGFEGPRDRSGEPRERREQGLGSGVIFRPDGYIVTNEHVVRGAEEIKVVLTDKREFDAKLIGGDAKTDLAVLKVEAGGLPHLPLGDSSQIDVGDIVLAMGNPFGLGSTVTMGIVSASGRGGIGIQDYEDFIQTDAAINPGNSGGALVDARGELVGINTAILSRTGGNQGIGFAVPTAMAKPVIGQLIDKGKVTRGWLGVVIQPVNAATAKAFKLKEARGALIGDVDPDGPAAKAGIQRGDVIVKLNGNDVEETRDLRNRIAMTPPGSTVKLAVVRDGQTRNVEAKLGELPEREQAARGPGESRRPLDGVDVQDLSPRIAAQLGLPRDLTGVVVTAVSPASPAADAGLRRGDVIAEVNRRAVANVPAFERAVRDAGSGQVILLVNRGGNTMYLVIEGR